MAVSDKLVAQASKQVGEQVLAAAMVIPPGATLYKSFAPGTSVAAAGGPLVAALLSKTEGAVDDGDASTVPTSQGVLAVAGNRVIYFKKKLFGVGVGDQLVEWPRSSLTFTYQDHGKWSYPGLLMEFADGSSCVVFGEKRWGLNTIAEAF